ncbi:response regulator [Paenibacillus chungangensis]|uniref:Response regulator n=1 Tax=Paenibacillus chungangensis TaxID=696535 RepID=A0ABW3HV89_9BACL
MYPILLVDDEPGALKSMKYLLDWEELGFTITGEARNGRQALEMYREGHYALIITDIRMPVMGGLELISHIRAEDDVPIIIMSGYEDFGYVKKALLYGVKDYLLKPAEAEDVQRLLESVARELEERRIMHQKLYHGVQALLENTVRNWATGVIAPAEAMRQLSLLGKAPKAEPGICCLAAELDLPQWEDPDWSDKELQTKLFAARNVLEEAAGSSAVLFPLEEMRFGIVISSMEEPLRQDMIIQLVEKMKAHTKEFAKIGVTMGSGSIVYDTADVSRSLEEARRMLEKVLFLGEHSWTGYSSAADAQAGSLAYAHDIAAIVGAMKEGQFRHGEGLQQQLWQAIASGQAPASHAKSAVVELYVELLRLVRELGAPYERLISPKRDDYETIMGMKTLAGLQQWSERKCKEAAEALELLRRSPAEQMVGTAIRWVNERYGEAISMKSIASSLYVNAAYLGQLFRDETGTSFNEYLLRVRMEKAKELLATTDRKVYEIAAAVGYNDIDWFYKKFKGYAGVSPKEYRMKG